MYSTSNIRRKLIAVIGIGLLAIATQAAATTYVYRTLLPGGKAVVPCVSGSISETSPGTYPVNIPVNCTVSITLNGAGGGGALGAGGAGAQLTGTLPANSNKTSISLVLQAGGTAGSFSAYSPAAGGGGYAALYSSNGALLAIAGGGGGAGGYGGNTQDAANGGPGGWTGGIGGEDVYLYCDNKNGISGQGGLATAPGSGGEYEPLCNLVAGNSGSGMSGGLGQTGNYGNGSSGGGGNGYFGGGGGSLGGDYLVGGGGGGGSSFASAAISGATVTTGGGELGGEGYPAAPTNGYNASASISWQ